MPRPKEKLHKSKSAVNAIKDKLTQFKSHYLGSSLEHGLFPDCKQAGAVYDVPRKMSLRRTSRAIGYFKLRYGAEIDEARGLKMNFCVFLGPLKICLVDMSDFQGAEPRTM